MEDHQYALASMQYKEAFSLIDKKGEGKIELDELKTVARVLGKDMTDEELRGCIKEVDPDGNGTITWEKFMEVMMKQNVETEVTTGDARKEATELFNIFDTNGNGQVAAEDFIHVLTNMGDKLPESVVNAALRDAEIDPDGKMTLDDFVKIIAVL